MDDILHALTNEIKRQVNIALEHKMNEIKFEKEEILEVMKNSIV